MAEEQVDSLQETLGKILELLPQETNFRRHSPTVIPEIVQALTSAAQVLHWQLVCDFGGRAGGERAPGLVEQAIAAAFQRFGEYNPYPSYFDKAAVMFRGIARRIPVQFSALRAGKGYTIIPLQVDEPLTFGGAMKEILSTITSKGQLTIPAEVRRHLGVHEHDKVAFVIEDDGEVKLAVPRYKDIDSVVGKAGSLKHPLSWEEMREIAREDRIKEEYQSEP